MRVAMAWHFLINAGFLQVVSTLVMIVVIYNLLQRLFAKVIGKPSQPATIQRRLGKSELVLDLLSQERGGTGNVCLILSLKSKTKLVKECVRNALVILAKRQPMLRAVITSSDAKDKYFEIINGDDLVDMIDFTCSSVKAREWQDVWHEITCKQRGTGLLWRAVLLQEEFLPETRNYTNTLIFQMNHTCCDGVSSIKLCEQFLGYLNDVAQKSHQIYEDINSLSLCPSLSDLLTRGRPWSPWKFVAVCFGIRHTSELIFKSRIRRLLSSKQCNPFFIQFPPSMEPPAFARSNLMYKVFSKTETSTIVKVCKSNESTVTGALMAAAHMAFCKLIKERCFNPKQVHLEHGFAINAQRNCRPKPPEEYLGQFVLSHSISIQNTEEEADFWKLARECTQRIHRDLKDEYYVTENMALFDSFSAGQYVTEILSPLDRQNLIRMSCCNYVSSAGSFDFDERKYCTYNLDQCLYNSLAHGFASTFSHFNVTVNGKMSWVILYDPSKVIHNELAEKFSNLCFNYFLQIDD